MTAALCGMLFVGPVPVILPATLSGNLPTLYTAPSKIFGLASRLLRAGAGGIYPDAEAGVGQRRSLPDCRCPQPDSNGGWADYVAKI